jgi:hypothetical protein
MLSVMEPESSWTQGEFWATAGQVIPVLGLALVLEARALAKTWVLDKPLPRRFEAAIVLVMAFALIYAFFETLSALALHEDAPRHTLAAATIIMQISFTVLALNATITVATRGTMDVGIAIERMLPWSARSRSARLIKKVQNRLPSLRAEAAAVIPMAMTLREQAIASAKRNVLLDEGELEEVREFLSAATPPRGLKERFDDVRGPALVDALDSYSARPTRTRAREVRRTRVRVATRLVALARAQNAEIGTLETFLQERRADLEKRPYSDSDRALLEQNLAAASEPGLFPWTPLPVGATEK